MFDIEKISTIAVLTVPFLIPDDRIITQFISALHESQLFRIVVLSGSRANPIVNEIAEKLEPVTTGVLEQPLAAAFSLPGQTLMLAAPQSVADISSIADGFHDLLHRQMNGMAPLDGVVLLVIDTTCDSRVLGTYLPILEPADPDEAVRMLEAAFELSREFNIPVLLRLAVPQAVQDNDTGEISVQNLPPLPLFSLHLAREVELTNYVDYSPWNVFERGDAKARRYGFIVSGPLYHAVKAVFPDAPVLRLGLSSPLPLKKIRGLIAQCEQAFVVEASTPINERLIQAEGFKVQGWRKHFAETDLSRLIDG